ncbi:hypothetical protein HanXRQr2_Chr11g0506451 [Helianthus annuus]|uniref:Uncharacterized protein n=1 Tax=Helianthus annuus TaxID=4232 RepID=A0A9K3HRP3_HELAN|nr:hypothetical protein HanXRQr2_Chr11g0506451 [Helianthus annuus]KAJ0876403.1 hypothetical protein HanPSC8_Chr11g0488011 [Helianthus annuus]
MFYKIKDFPVKSPYCKLQGFIPKLCKRAVLIFKRSCIKRLPMSLKFNTTGFPVSRLWTGSNRGRGP